MKKAMYMFATVCAAAALSVACTEKEPVPQEPEGQEQTDPDKEENTDPEEPQAPEEVKPAVVQDVTGIEATYELTVADFLAIEPVITTDEGDKSQMSYEWKLGDTKIGEEATLNYQCNEQGSYNASFTILSGENEPFVKEFTVNVNAPVSYDNQGLVLLSETAEGAMISYKRLDLMDAKTYRSAFADANPEYKLGSKGLDIEWFGSELGRFTVNEGDLDLIVSSADPNKIYLLDPATLKVRREISCAIPANEILIPNCSNVGPFSGERAYFIGNEVEKVLTPNGMVTNSNVETTYELADIASSITIRDGQDVDAIRVYYDRSWRKLGYVSSLTCSWYGKEGAYMPGDYNMGEPIYMKGCDGTYLTDEGNLYLTSKIFVAAYQKEGNDRHNQHRDESMRIIKLSPISVSELEETKLSDIDMTGKILPDAAIAVNPVRSNMYYSSGSNVNVMSYDGDGTDSKVLLTLNGNYAIRQMTFNVYDPDTLYIAAENLDETGNMKASLFVYNIEGDAEATELFHEDQVGGKICKLIYKGLGTDHESAPALN